MTKKDVVIIRCAFDQEMDNLKTRIVDKAIDVWLDNNTDDVANDIMDDIVTGDKIINNLKSYFNDVIDELYSYMDKMDTYNNGITNLLNKYSKNDNK